MCILVIYTLMMIIDKACMCAKSRKSCPTLCYPMNYSPPASSVHGIFQARILGWVAILTTVNKP